MGLAYYLGQRHAGMTLRELGKCMGEVEYPAVSSRYDLFPTDSLKIGGTFFKTRSAVSGIGAPLVAVAQLRCFGVPAKYHVQLHGDDRRPHVWGA